MKLGEQGAGGFDVKERKDREETGLQVYAVRTPCAQRWRFARSERTTLGPNANNTSHSRAGLAGPCTAFLRGGEHMGTKGRTNTRLIACRQISQIARFSFTLNPSLRHAKQYNTHYNRGGLQLLQSLLHTTDMKVVDLLLSTFSTHTTYKHFPRLMHVARDPSGIL